MRRSTEFGATVKHGLRTAQPDIVIHRRVCPGGDDPRVGFIVAKSVGSAVQRHRVARRLRHVTRAMLPELLPGEQVVIRARPSCGCAASAGLERQLRVGLRRVRDGAR